MKSNIDLLDPKPQRPTVTITMSCEDYGLPPGEDCAIVRTQMSENTTIVGPDPAWLRSKGVDVEAAWDRALGRLRSILERADLSKATLTIGEPEPPKGN
jgi:hypothetical protein